MASGGVADAETDGGVVDRLQVEAARDEPHEAVRRRVVERRLRLALAGHGSPRQLARLLDVQLRDEHEVMTRDVRREREHHAARGRRRRPTPAAAPARRRRRGDRPPDLEHGRRHREGGRQHEARHVAPEHPAPVAEDALPAEVAGEAGYCPPYAPPSSVPRLGRRLVAQVVESEEPRPKVRVENVAEDLEEDHPEGRDDVGDDVEDELRHARLVVVALGPHVLVPPRPRHVVGVVVELELVDVRVVADHVLQPPAAHPAAEWRRAKEVADVVEPRPRAQRGVAAVVHQVRHQQPVDRRREHAGRHRAAWRKQPPVQRGQLGGPQREEERAARRPPCAGRGCTSWRQSARAPSPVRRP